jgi:hypothetical protein
MRKFLAIILVTISMLFVQSCENSCSINRKIKLITGNSWKINSYIDYSVNLEMSIVPELYRFDVDGHYTKIRECDTLVGTWSFVDCNYLKMGSQTFKIAELSRKMMVLRYGDVDLVYRRNE